MSYRFLGEFMHALSLSSYLIINSWELILPDIQYLNVAQTVGEAVLDAGLGLDLAAVECYQDLRNVQRINGREVQLLHADWKKERFDNEIQTISVLPLSQLQTVTVRLAYGLQPRSQVMLFAAFNKSTYDYYLVLYT